VVNYFIGRYMNYVYIYYMYMYVCMLYHAQNLHIILRCTLYNFIISTHPPPLLAGRVGLESMMKR